MEHQKQRSPAKQNHFLQVFNLDSDLPHTVRWQYRLQAKRTQLAAKGQGSTISNAKNAHKLLA